MISLKKILLFIQAFSLLFFAFLNLAIFSLPMEGNRSLNSSSDQEFSRLFIQAEKCRHEGEFEKSISFFEKSLNLAKKNKNEKSELESLRKLGLLYWNIGSLKESLKFYDSALSLAKKLNLLEIQEESQCAIEIYKFYSEGKELRNSEQYQKSIESFQRAIDLSRKINSKEHEVKCLRQLSLTYWLLNNLQEFFSLNKKAFKIAQELNHIKEEGNCLNNIGIYYWKLDNFFKALECYKKALEIAYKLENIQGETECLNNIGVIYKDLGNYEKSLDYLEKALSIDKELKDELYIAADLNNIGVTYRKKGLLSDNKKDFNKALNYFNDCLNLIKKTKDKKKEVQVLNNIGTVYSDMEKYNEALNYLRIALNKAEIIADTGEESTILYNIGIVHANQGNYEESTKYYQKAIDLALEIKGGQILWEAYLEMANALKKQGKSEEALENYKNSISVIEDIRSKIKLEELKASYLGTDKRIEAYQNLIDLLASLNKSHPGKHFRSEAFNYLERAKARAFLDSLEVSEVGISQGIDVKLANQEKELMNNISKIYIKLLAPQLTPDQKNALNEELKTYEDKLESLKNQIRISSPAYANLRYPEIITVEEAQKKLLDTQTAFLAYSIGKESSYAFSLSKNELKIFPLPSRKELQKQVADYLKVITDKENHDFHLGYKLYQELILPGLDKNIKKIFIVPDDILYFLPFETLITHKNAKSWLIMEYKLAYVPSLSSFRELVRRDKMNREKVHKDILAFGDPDFGPYETEEKGNNGDIFQNFYSTSAFKFFRLKYSGLEISRIASLFKSSKRTIFLRERASEEELKAQNLADYKIIHFATHGLIDDKKPARSSIILCLDQNPTEDGFLQMREIFNIKLHADLVTLSACQTGLGQFIRGEGIEGLSRAFFYAGASSVSMSLWAINDQASYQLMERFYFHLRKSESIMNALRLAKLEMIESGTLSHPYYWAGFIITGKADKVIFPRSRINWILLATSLCVGGIILITVKNLKRKKA